jgi:hypothetical protein
MYKYIRFYLHNYVTNVVNFKVPYDNLQKTSVSFSDLKSFKFNFECLSQLNITTTSESCLPYGYFQW